MQASNTRDKTNFSDGCQDDHRRQQERLKSMSTTPDKVKTVSADLMIENLLKDTFKKPGRISVPVGRTDHFYLGLPVWLQCESTAVPPLYNQLWSLVALTEELADTQKVSQLLLSSGLQIDVLGFIWSLANKVIPGQLTKQEFYIVLALVSLAQTGCTFNSLNVLKHIPVPAIPILQCSSFANTPLQTCVPQSPVVPSDNSFQQIPNVLAQQSGMRKNKRDNVSEQIRDFVRVINFCDEKQNGVCLDESVTSCLVSGSMNYGSDDSSKTVNTISQQDAYINKRISKNSNFPYIGISPTSELEDDFSEFQSVPAKISEATESAISLESNMITDDFTEFQSANIGNLDPFQTTVVVTQTREIPKILLPKGFSEKLTNLKTNVIKISPESERRLKVLSTTESLSSLPESKISSTNKVSTSISVLGGLAGVSSSSRLANHSFSYKPDKEKCYKHQKHKAIQSSSADAEEIIFGVKPICVGNLMTKCHPKNLNTSKPFFLKETKIKNDEISEGSLNDKNGNEESVLNISSSSSKENTRRIEIPMLGTFNETVLPTEKKFKSFSPDLISVQEDKYSALREMDLVLNQENNDSGEKNDEFGDFLSANIPPPPPASVKADPPTISFSPLLLENDGAKSLGDLNFNAEPKSELNTSLISKDSVVGETKSKSETTIEDSFDTFNSFKSFNEKHERPKYMPAPIPAVQRDIFSATEIYGLSKDGSKDDIDSFYDKSEKTNTGLRQKSDQFGSQLDTTEFWDFLSSEVKFPAEATLSRQDSLPSLDLNVSAIDETEQEVIWRKCLESCHNLIREGFEKFNSIQVKSVLDEVFSSSKTGQYLNCLHIVYQISKRISQNFGDLPSIQEELEKLWRRLQELCFEYNIKLTPFEEEVTEGASQCCICLKYVARDLINQGVYSYHPSCANLWINLIEGTLPFST